MPSELSMPPAGPTSPAHVDAAQSEQMFGRAISSAHKGTSRVNSTYNSGVETPDGPRPSGGDGAEKALLVSAQQRAIAGQSVPALSATAIVSGYVHEKMRSQQKDAQAPRPAGAKKSYADLLQSWGAPADDPGQREDGDAPDSPAVQGTPR